jgi:hypothetical protein
MAFGTGKQAANAPALPGRAVRKSLRRKNISSQVAAVRSDKASRRTVSRPPKVPHPHDVNVSTDRLVMALVVMVQQAHRNRLRDAGTLDPSSKRRNA